MDHHLQSRNKSSPWKNTFLQKQTCLDDGVSIIFAVLPIPNGSSSSSSESVRTVLETAALLTASVTLAPAGTIGFDETGAAYKIAFLNYHINI